MKALYEKLLNIQKKVLTISKDSTNPFFKSKYFDINKLLDELKPVLNEEGLIVLQPLTNVEGKLALETMVIDKESGDQIKSITILPDVADPQKAGSAITYFRRYALQSFFLLQSEDDDGEKATTHEEKKSSMIKNDPKSKVVLPDEEPFIS